MNIEIKAWNGQSLSSVDFYVYTDYNNQKLTMTAYVWKTGSQMETIERKEKKKIGLRSECKVKKRTNNPDILHIHTVEHIAT